jgi:NAD(P)-dependent dehydrogenase (short-subunit alcohol dehydrogenase family)
VSSEAIRRASLFDLSGKVALISGGNHGIGLAIALALGAAGSDVVIWGTNPVRNEEARCALSKLPVRSLVQTVNVSEEGRVVDAVKLAADTMGRIDCVFASAGVSGHREPFATMSTENLRNVLAVNLEGVFWTFRETCKHMIDRASRGDPGGSLVAISSLGVVHGMPRFEPYSMSKGAVGALVRSIAVEYARYGIRANTVAPGWIDTGLNTELRSEKATQHILPRIPLRRWGRADDIAGIAVYLASEASSYHTADFFLIDGGYAAF